MKIFFIFRPQLFLLPILFSFSALFALDTTQKTISVEKLIKDSSNGINYQGKTVKVKGLIGSVISNGYGSTLITLETSDHSNFIRFVPSDPNADWIPNIQEGQIITIQGIYNGIQSNKIRIDGDLFNPASVIHYEPAITVNDIWGNYFRLRYAHGERNIQIKGILSGVNKVDSYYLVLSDKNPTRFAAAHPVTVVFTKEGFKKYSNIKMGKVITVKVDCWPLAEGGIIINGK